MKRFLFSVVLAIFAMNLFAQQSEQNVGAHILYGTDASNIGVGVKYQRNITDPIRLEAVGDLYLKKDGFFTCDLNVNANYLFPLTEKITAYPLAGVNYTYWHQDGIDEIGGTGHKGTLGINLGGGCQYQLIEKVRIGVEFKYQSFSPYNTVAISAGVTYTL